MSTNNLPAWTRRARRLEGVPIDHYWRPEEGAVEGTVVAHTQERNRFRPGELSDLVIVEEAGTQFHTAIRIRTGLEALHTVVPGSRLFVSPHSPRPASSGKGSLWSFDIYVDDASPSDAADNRGQAGGSDLEQT